MPSLLVIGSGPGIALSTAALFAEKKFNKVALLARSPERLPQDKAGILEILKSKGKKDIEVVTWSVDISNSAAFKKVLGEVEQKYDDLTCVLFNAAKVAPSQLLEYPEEEIVKDFMTTNIGLYTAAQWAVPILGKKEVEDKPSFFVTSSLLWKRPFPMYFSLSLVKTSQRNLVQSLVMSYLDIHFALLNIEGQVNPDSKDFSPTLIAERVLEAL